MNVLIISSNRNRQPVAVMPIGACIAAEAAERIGHKVSFLDLMFSRDIKGEVEKIITKVKPDIIGISIRNIDDNFMNKPRSLFEDLSSLTEIIKNKSNAKIILGGAAVPLMPEQLLRYSGTDLAVLGYGESIFPKLLQALEQKRPFEEVEGIGWIENGNFRKNEINGARLNDCPVPDFWRWINLKAYLSRFSTIPVQTKRGCPYKCIYCTYANIEGENYHLSNAHKVVNRIKKLAAKGLYDIEFVDNVFNSPYDHAFDICSHLAHAKLPVRLQSMELNPRFIDDYLLEEMEKAGFIGIGLTAESTDDKVLESLGKDYTTQDVHQAAEVINRHKLPCFWLFLLGGPKETPDTIKRTLTFAQQCIRKGDTVFFNVGIRIYPGTRLETIAREEGVLDVGPEEMLNPKFYFSPLLEKQWLYDYLNQTISQNLNFIDPDSFTMPALSKIQRLLYILGIKHPLWKYTRTIRKISKLAGIYK